MKKFILALLISIGVMTISSNCYASEYQDIEEEVTLDAEFATDTEEDIDKDQEFLDNNKQFSTNIFYLKAALAKKILDSASDLSEENLQNTIMIYQPLVDRLIVKDSRENLKDFSILELEKE